MDVLNKDNVNELVGESRLLEEMFPHGMDSWLEAIGVDGSVFKGSNVSSKATLALLFEDYMKPIKLEAIAGDDVLVIHIMLNSFESGFLMGYLYRDGKSDGR